MSTLKTIILFILGFGVFQLFFKMYVSTIHMQVPSYRECQCARHLQINMARERARDDMTAADDALTIVNSVMSDGNSSTGSVLKLSSKENQPRQKIRNHKLEEQKANQDAKIVEKERRELEKQENGKLKEEIESPEEEMEREEKYGREEEEPEKEEEGQAKEEEGQAKKELKLENEELNVVAPMISTYFPLKLNPLMDDRRSRCKRHHSSVLLIYVYTAPANFIQRSRIRSTWGSVNTVKDKEIRVIFFIGALSTDTAAYFTVESKLLNESALHGDIVQDLSYVDAYRNLTLKGISAMQWISKYCPSPYRIVKVDDDTMVNPFQMVNFLSGQSDITMGEIICTETNGSKPIRNPKSKYFVPVEEYDVDYYPLYCQGYGYIMPPYILPKLLKYMKETKLLSMEDIYFTGLVRLKAGIRLHPLLNTYATKFNSYENFVGRITVRPKLMLIGHVHEERSANVFWRIVTQREGVMLRKDVDEESKKNITLPQIKIGNP